MGSPGKITASGEGKPPRLERILNRLLRCSHRHQTSPITLRGETFATCLDCGSHVPYSLDGLRAPMPVKAAVQETKAAVRETKLEVREAKPAVQQSKPAIQQSKPQTKPAIQQTKPAVRETKRPVRKPLVPPKPVGSKIRSTLRTWTNEGVWLGLLAAGLAGAVYYSGKRQPLTPDQALSRPVPAQAAITVATPGVPGPETPVAVPAMAQVLRPPSQKPHLDGGGRFVVLAHEPAAAREVSQHPAKLGELIQIGSLFTVSRGTAVRLLEKQKDVDHVAIVGGPMAGQDGWVPAAQVQE